MDEIVTGLYISGADIVISSKGREKLNNVCIKNIITISAMSIPDDKKISGIGYSFLLCLDQPEQDILGNNFLHNAISIVEKKLSEGRLLIHCEQGISRSATLCIAYVMKIFNYTFSRAYELIKAKHPQACPNSGFVKQLQIFEKLSYDCSEEKLRNSNEYKIWCSNTGNIPKISTSSVSLPHEYEENKSNVVKYRCRKCRNILFNSCNLMVHEIKKKERKNKEDNNQICGFGYYLMPLDWMSLNDIQGKINCPKCNEKIGHYNWSGKECVGESNRFCNEFITPWIYIQKGKVDEMKRLKIYSEKSGNNSPSNDNSSMPKIIITS